MLTLLAATILVQGPDLQRDDFGVAHIKAASLERAFFEAGYAVAQDRLWQMENSRRVARGKMAEAFGPSFVASDKEILAQAYTDAELDQQIQQGLDSRCRTMLSGYVQGVNAWIEEATAKNLLPPGYANNGLKPEPWTERDSAAITIRLFQQFGKGGAGEIRNMALLGYLQARKETKDRVLDVLQDFAWFQDPTATTTISERDDPLAKSHPTLPIPTRAVSERHLASLPKVGLLELLPGVRLAEHQESNRIAELVGAPFKWGSYAIVISPQRSATGTPILLSAPQMGFRTPSIIHEMSIEAPGYRAVGMDVPGVPGIAIGHNPYLAWGLTSGVADTDDIFTNATDATGYIAEGKSKPIQNVTFTLKVKGSPDQTVVQRRTEFGPIVVESKSGKVVFSRKSASRMVELESLQSVAHVAAISDVKEVDEALRHATVNFNCFFATADGQIGYRFTGRVPNRKPGFDPRFPLPGNAESAWDGMIPFEQMPHVLNPGAGILANWNNKPTTWWTNSDTPVWGKIFRNTEVLACLQAPKISVADVERTAWTIARRDETWPYFKPFVEKVWTGTRLEGFDGWMVDGSRQARLYQYFLDDLRDQLFLGVTGNFISPDNFRLVGQPSVMLAALSGKTKVNYLQGRSANNVVRTAIEKASARLDAKERYSAPPIPVPGQSPIPYSNRGSYIQVVELLKDGPWGRNVVTPGVSESGDHSLDQAPLARAWTFKPMRWRN
ncbi:MAG: penicillin acylase family protein [Fimbriimonadaceae bacterium]|nr:penicillin acylase family protein [Fimbriimonadaceae bacterium]